MFHPPHFQPANDTEEALIAGARALAPILRQRANATSEARTLPAETINNFAEAGFWRMLQPRRWGGLEVDPRTFFATQIEVAKGCPSTAWVLGVVAVHAWQLAIFDERAQQEVWGGNDGAALISSSYMPVGKVQHVQGGYELSGRWSFSSGCDHCQWIFVGAFVPPKEEGQQPDMRTFLVPRADYEILDVWHTSGLRGTGSKDIVIDGAFVPEHRTHRFADGFKCESPGNRVNTGPLYRIPFGQIFVRSVSTTAIGIAEKALQDYCEVAVQRVSQARGTRIKEEPHAQAIAAQGYGVIDEVKQTLFRNFAVMWDYAEAGEPMPIELRARFRNDSARTVEQCMGVVDALFTQSGGRAIFEDHPLNRAFADIHAARAHFANKPGPSAINLGRMLFGGQTTDFFL